MVASRNHFLVGLSVFVSVLGAYAIGAVSQTPIESPRTIRVVVDNAYAPYSFQSDDGKLQGILIDQWQAWEKKTGIKAEIHAVDWGEALRRLRAGEFDVIDSIVETSERQVYFDFTSSYTTIEASIYFRRDISGISDLGSLKGFPVGVKAGDQHIDQLKANGVSTVIEFQNNDAIVEAAKQHKVNVFLADDPSALYLLNKLGMEEEFRHSAPVFRDQLRRAVRKGDAATLRVVSDGFAVVDAGELMQIDEKWFGRTINGYRLYLVYAGYAAAAAIILIAFLLGWNSMLRKRVLQRTALLHARQQEFQAIVENAPDQIIRYDRNFRRAYVNPAVARAYGLPSEALIGKPIGSVIEDAGLDVKEDELAELRQQIAKVFDSGQSYEYELNWPLATGRRYFSVRLFPELDLNGSIVNVLGISRDITEHKLAEDALDERLRFETLLTELSATFANLSANEVDREIDNWLKTLAEFLGVDRASFFQFEEDWTTLYRSHSYTVTGMKPLPSLPIGMKDQFPWITEQLSRGITVKWSRIPDDMPEEAVKEREYAASLGAKSGLNIPVLMGGSVICAITFTSIATYRDWPDALVARLRLVGEIFAGAVERKRAEAALKKEKETFEKIFDNIPVMIGFVDEDGVRLVNPEWERTIGWTLKELQEQNADIFVEAYPDAAYRQRVLGLVDAATGEWFDLKIRVRDGRIIDAACAVVHLSDGTRVAIAQDITERKRSEEHIQETSEQLRALSARLQSAKEEEDIRIAREIHDEMGSSLTSLRWELERFDEVVSETNESSKLQALRVKIADMVKLTDVTIGAMRRIASELRPSILDDLGLAEAIEWQSKQFQSRTGIVCRCACSLEDLEFDHEKATAIFRIFQEALTNVLSHSAATAVEVVARAENGSLVLTVSDNGRGITEHEKTGRLSLGILGMRERAHLIGGEVEINGIEGRGTIVTVSVPISPSE